MVALGNLKVPFHRPDLLAERGRCCLYRSHEPTRWTALTLEPVDREKVNCVEDIIDGSSCEWN